MEEGTSKILEEIERFHGHVGPYAVLGYKIGEAAKQILGPNPFTKKAIVFAPLSPPSSCMIDGIQISSGCTLGKRNIEVREDKDLKVIFEGEGVVIEIRAKPEVIGEIERALNGGEEKTIEMCKRLMATPAKKLLEVRVCYEECSGIEKREYNV